MEPLIVSAVAIARKNSPVISPLRDVRNEVFQTDAKLIRTPACNAVATFRMANQPMRKRTVIGESIRPINPKNGLLLTDSKKLNESTKNPLQIRKATSLSEKTKK